MSDAPATRLGPRLIYAALAATALSLAALWSPALWWIGPVLMAGVGGAAWVDRSRARQILAGMEVRREAPERVGRGREFVVTLKIWSAVEARFVGAIREECPNAARPRLREQTFRVNGRQVLTLEYPVTIGDRGLHEFGRTWVRATGPWSLMEAQAPLGDASTVRVLPLTAVPSDELREDPLGEERFLEQHLSSRIRGDGNEFESLAEYRPGADVRRVDWRASARHRSPVVRRYQQERHRDVMILVDCGRLMGARHATGSKLDWAVDAALLLSRVALKRGDRCGLAVFDDAVLGYLPPRAGKNAHRPFVDALYDRQPRWRETNFASAFVALQTRQPKRSLVVVLSDLVDADTTARYRSALVRLRRRHRVVFVAMRTPLLGEIVGMPMHDTHDLARKVVSLNLLREREAALHALSKAGIDVLDVEPSRSLVPLINRYLEIRKSGEL
ncbi:MAG: DUF58 domain-containing protein [Deltaproteobacteria bacterium]|nr:DUF58 domain-containing protein [Deltaproteobacteria bacterium]